MVFTIISIVVISIIGTLAHFLYDLSGHNKFIGVFAAVNESVWEHVKIALTPTLLWGLVDGFIDGENPNYFLAKTASLIAIMILMPLLFYGHKIISKKDFFVLDIISFYIVVIASQLTFYYLLQIPPVNFVVYYLSCVGLFGIFGSYMISTFLPMKNIVFQDPLTHKYGFKAHSDKFNPFRRWRKRK